MSNATKIDAGTWSYRGFAIKADYNSPSTYRQCKTRQGFRIANGPATAGECYKLRDRWAPSLVSAVEQIDEWNERYDSGKFHEGSNIPAAVEAARKAAAKPLVADLHLNSHAKFWAVLEALQQYIDNGNDADHLADDEELQAKLRAAEQFRDQLDAVLASLAEA